MNGRGNGALQKMGARREAVLRKSFSSNGCDFDQFLWSILEVDWRSAKTVWGPKAPLDVKAAASCTEPVARKDVSFLRAGRHSCSSCTYGALARPHLNPSL